VTLIALLAAWLLAASAGAEGEPAPTGDLAPPLVGSHWRWERTLMNDDSVHEPPAAESRRYTVRFGEDRKLSIRADCNRVLGHWTLEGRSIAIEAGPTTMVECPEGSLADVFLADLSAAALHFVHDGDLYLDLKFDSGTMQLAPLTTALAGTRWRVTGYNHGEQAVVSVLIGTEITAEFGTDGRVVGRAGCNAYQASYATKGSTVTVGPPAATRMHCGEPEGVMEQERLYLVALQRAASRSLDGDQLELRSANGTLAVTLMAETTADR
jgi:heat shock protein HslJ